MKHSISILILLFSYLFSFGQEKYSYEFEKLDITDTIYNNEEIKSLKSDIEYSYSDYFFADRYFKGEIEETIHCMIKKNHDYWISYAIPYEYGLNQSSFLIGPSENKKYFLASSYYNHLSHEAGGGNENTIEKLIIIDIENNSYVQIKSYTKDQYWQQDEEGESYIVNDQNSMISKFIFEDNHLIILNTCLNSEGMEDCPNPGGLYEFKNNKLRKIKNYNPLKLGFTAINYIGEIAIGMTLEEVKLVYPNVQFIQKENIYGSCADAKTGYEVWNDNELLGFIITKPADKIEGEEINYANQIIVQFLVFSAKFNFEKISINNKVSEVLKMYPKANVRIDLLTEWEHIYIKDLNIELIFKTDENNRIGIYKNEEFVQLKNGKAKANFIQVN